MPISREHMCEHIYINFKFLPKKHKEKLAKFIYMYDNGLIREYSGGVIAPMNEMPDVLIAHIYNYVSHNVWTKH